MDSIPGKGWPHYDAEKNKNFAALSGSQKSA